MQDLPEFRKDLVSGDWILVAAGRRKRPYLVKKQTSVKLETDINKCPFENPQKSGNSFPLLWYPKPKTAFSRRKNLNSWFLQVIPNKYPLLYQDSSFRKCPQAQKSGAKETFKAVGYHEVIITRSHFKTIDKMEINEIALILQAYRERFRILAKDPCVKYILIFHNQGEAAGASIFHPHSQLVALPVVDPDLSRSLNGSRRFYKRHKKCVHCVMLEQELKDKRRIIYQNKHFVSLVPFASRVSYEIRIYPLKHLSNFERISDKEIVSFAQVLRDALKRIVKGLKNPDYNFFIHSAPVNSQGFFHYHWHLEILPRGFKWAGLELGSGIEVVAVPPEEAAEHLKRIHL